MNRTLNRKAVPAVERRSATPVEVEGAGQEGYDRCIGYDLLGPVIHRWLLALHQYRLHLDDGKTAFLSCARAGVRIAKLYEIFQRGFSGADEVFQPKLFWISRIAAAKGVFGRIPERAATTIAREYHHLPLRMLVEGMLRHHPGRLSALDLSGDDLKAHGHNFSGWIKVEGPVQRGLRDYFASCTTAFDRYLGELVAGCSRAVLIDSGWGGTTQSLLTHARPEIEWKGLYFGRMLLQQHDASILPHVVGLMFERDTYDPAVPESAFVRHRHLIECLLESNGPSIEEIPASPFVKIAKRQIAANLDETPDIERDGLYLQVRRYLEDQAGLPLSEILRRHQEAMPELARMIVTPSRNEARMLSGKHRTADFGKTLKVPVLIENSDGVQDQKDHRIRDALWAEGQIALEYEGAIARELQLRLNGIIDGAGYFDPIAAEKQGASENAVRFSDPSSPKIAVITRTKNRPLLLRRAADSVASQTDDDYVWVVINDGGDEQEARAVIEDSGVDRRRIRLVSHLRSLGMEAASNAGIRASSSDFIVIHDDDDSWAPDFLEKMVAFLESPAGARYGGVISHSLYVSEEIRGEMIIEHGRWPYQDWVRNVQIAEMTCGNFFPPIAFVFRRSVWEKTGGYNEHLPVLGDWFFNLEFLLHADIGVLPEPLAFYHHRDRGDSRAGLYSNSVVGGVSKHEEFAAIVRNEFLRRHSDKPSAISILLGYIVGDMRGRLDRARISPTLDITLPSAQGFSDQRLDLYWLAAQLNRAMIDRLQQSSKLPDALPLIDPQAGWNNALSMLHRADIEIPSPDDFDEDAYLASNPDVAEAIRKGNARSGYVHYLLYGRTEGRQRPTRNK